MQIAENLTCRDTFRISSAVENAWRELPLQERFALKLVRRLRKALTNSKELFHTKGE